MNNLSGFQTQGYTEKEEWTRIYDAILEGELEHFPHDFWESSGKKKAQVLMKHFREEKDLDKQEILDTPNRKLIRQANLYSALRNCYGGDSVALLTDAFGDVEPNDFRWTANREIDWEKVKQFREHYCTISAIADYFGCQPEVIQSRAKKKGIELSLPDEKGMIQASVKEVELFWENAEKALEDEISLEEMFKNVAKQNDWSRSKISNLVNRYNIKEETGRAGTKIGKKVKLKNYSGRLYPSEEFVAEKLNKDELVVLDGYGADFTYKGEILIEAKKSLSTYNTPKALLQLVYAEDKLRESYDKRVYAKELGSLEGEESSYRSFTHFYDIGVYTYNKDSERFEKIQMRAEKFSS